MKKLFIILFIASFCYGQALPTVQKSVSANTVTENAFKISKKGDWFWWNDTSKLYAIRDISANRNIYFSYLNANNRFIYVNEFIGAFKLSGRDTAKADYIYTKTYKGTKRLYWRRADATEVPLDSLADKSLDSTKLAYLAKDNVFTKRNEFNGAFKILGVDTAKANYIYSKLSKGTQRLFWRRADATEVPLDSLVDSGGSGSFDSTKTQIITNRWTFRRTALDSIGVAMQGKLSIRPYSVGNSVGYYTHILNFRTPSYSTYFSAVEYVDWNWRAIGTATSVNRAAADLTLFYNGLSDPFITFFGHNGGASAGYVRIYSPLTTTQYKLSALNTAPTSASSAGVTGDIRITSDYIYICVATDTWKRVAIATW